MILYLVRLIDTDTICGVYTSREKAEKSIEIMQEEDDIYEGNHYYTKEEWREFFTIDEYLSDEIYNVKV